MNATHLLARPSTTGAVLSRFARAAAAAVCVALAACGGSADAPPPPESGPVGPTAVPPTITQQPASLGVTAGQPASFSVAASGTAPISYQWQRNGTDIAGATSTTYTIATTALSDSGAVFHAIASNVAGSATSSDATLTVTAAAPVLTITQQPVSVTVVAGETATFTVAGTCSGGTLDVQWQRSNDGGATFLAIAGATSPSYSVMPASSDSGALFDAVLDCSGQSAVTSSGATLTVTAPSSVTLSLLPITGLRPQADVHNTAGIVQDSQYSFSFIAGNHVKRLSADLTTIASIAGGSTAGAVDGPGATASFNQPTGITEDVAGALYVTDTANNTIRKIATDGTVSTLAGSAGVIGAADGSGPAAQFNAPMGIAIGPDGDLYVADTANNLIRRVTTAGVVTTYAGGGGGTFVDGPAASARFNAPTGIAVASTGDLYVADHGNRRIRLVARSGGTAGTAGNVSTIAGDGTDGESDGVGTAAQIGTPTALSIMGNVLYVGDGAQRIRTIDLTTLAVTTFAGSSNVQAVDAEIDGPVGAARFTFLAGMVASASSGLLVADRTSIRRVDTAGTTSTIATSAVEQINATGLGTLPQVPFAFNPSFPPGLVVEPGQSVVVLDPVLQLLRRISPTGSVSLIAGFPDSSNSAVSNGAVDGQGSAAQLTFQAQQIARDSTGTLYLADQFGVRKVTADGTVSFIAGSPTVAGQTDGSGSAATFYTPSGIAIGPNGDLFVSDVHEIRRVTQAGVVTTYAGDTTSGQVDGPVASARFGAPTQLAFAPDGTLYIVDNNIIRTISADGQQVSTLSGTVIVGAGIYGGGIAVDSSGTLYYGGSVAGGPIGLHQRTAAGVDTLLIPLGSVVTGSSPAVALPLTIAIRAEAVVVVDRCPTTALHRHAAVTWPRLR